MIPSVGRIVHYTSLGDRDGKYPAEVQAALVTKVKPLSVPDLVESPFENSYTVSLRVFYEDGDFGMKQVPFTTARAGSEEARGKWTWPERI